MLETLIPVAGNLLSGLLGNKSAKKAAAQERAWALEDQKLQWVRHREASELGGFNPLATLGLGQGVASTSASANNYMGEAIATSSLMLADSLAKTKAAASGRKVEDLNRQRDILTRKLANATLRPTVPGVFDRARNFGTGAANANTVSNVVVGDNNGSSPTAGRPDRGPTDLRPLASTDWVDPRREVENKPVSSTSGFMVVDSPYLPLPLRAPTLDGDEPLQWYDYPSLAIPFGIMGAEMAYNAGRDYSSRRWKQRLIDSYKPREFWTHPQTGFSAVRR